MTQTRLHSLLLVLTAVLLSGICFGQATGVPPASGTPPFGSFGGGPFDTVNLGNLNVHFSIPVLHKAGRGLPFNYDLGYDSSVWQPVGVSGSQSWQPVSSWGWMSTWTGTAGYITNTSSGEYCYGGNGYPIGHTETISGWAYYDPWGANHSFSGELVNSDCPGVTNISSFTSLAPDGSGYTINVGVPGAWPIVNSMGVGFTPASGPPAGPVATTKSDTNGNQITSDSSGHFTDTLGSQVLTITGSSPVNFAYTSPSGASAAYVLHYTTKTVKTAFGCSGIAEYGPTSASLVSDITLPDGSQYLFAYEPTPGFAGDYTGRIQSVTLPTGGTITYTYTGGAHGITCSDGSTSGLTRVLNPGGTWTYARSNVSGTHWTTTMTDPTTPTHNQTVIDFQEDSATTSPSNNFYETQRLTYQGATTGTLLQTAITCYNGRSVATPSACLTTAVASPISRTTTFKYLPDSSGKRAESDVFYNNYGLVTQVSEYAYGDAVVGPMLRQTVTGYAGLGNGIVDRPSSIAVYDGQSHLQSSTSYAYDESAYPLQGTSGIPNHTNPVGSRGNATTASVYTGSTTLSMHLQYYDTGSLYKSQDVNTAWTTYAYGTGSCNWAFPTQVTQPLGISTSTSWDCTGGVAKSFTDANGKTATMSYTDPYFWRPASTQDQTLNTTQLRYSSANVVESYLTFNNNASIAEQLTTMDGFGRIRLSQQQHAPGSASYDSSETKYDSAGRLYQVIGSYVGTAGQYSAGGTPVANTTSYDAMGRTTQNVDGGGGYITYVYTKNDILYTLGPAPAGENVKARQLEYDSLGRLTSVCEITTAANGGGACAQASARTGYWTKYVYDAPTINSVQYTRVTVTQNAQSSQTQTRTYLLDLVGRLVSEANPENGTVTYKYDSASGCTSTCPGNMVQRIDNKGNTASYTYDALHRVTSVTYSGPDSANTPAKYFVYDTATVNGVTMLNVPGRLAEAYTGSPSSKSTDIGLSYSARGEVTDVYESTLHSNGYYHTGSSFWANGALATLTSNLVGLPNQTYGVDSKGRIATVSAGSGQNPVTATSYDPVSLQTTVTYGSLDADVFSFDPNTGRLIQYKNNVGSKSVTGYLTWNANGTLQKLQITDGLNALNTQTCAVGYDDLVRVASMNCGTTIWNQTFAYDPFGNIQKSVPAGSTGVTFLPGYSTSTNQFTSLPGATPGYDANGNLTADGSHNYAWDAEGKMLSVDTNSVLVTYDALGRMVEQNRSGAYMQIVYTPSGGKFALMSGQSLTRALVPLPAGGTAVYKSSGLAYYRHSDWLGSSRLATTPTRTLYASVAYAPFGEPYAQSGAQDLSFTGQDQDTVAGIHDFAFRKYNPVHGRWMSPDPAGFGAANFDDPQTLNRYAYVRNNPLALIDPLGLDDCGDDSDPADCCDTDCGGGGGGDDGGGGGDNGGGGGDNGGGGGDNGGGDSGGQGGSDDQPPVIDIPPGQMPDLLFTPVIPTFAGQVNETVDVTETTPDPIELESTTVNLTGQAGQVGNALLKLQKLLPLDPKCLRFLTSPKANPLYRLNQILKNNLYGVATIQPTATSMNNGDIGLVRGQAITVNTLGAFFNSSYNNMPLTTDRGNIRGNTPQAQVFIVLHELAHTTNVINQDGGKGQGAIDANDKTIEKNCKQTVNAAGK